VREGYAVGEMEDEEFGVEAAGAAGVSAVAGARAVHVSQKIDCYSQYTYFIAGLDLTN
jgi:hypothetical protein